MTFDEWWDSDEPEGKTQYRADTPVHWARLAWDAAAAAEREACAKVCEELRYPYPQMSGDTQPKYPYSFQCAAAIRARDEK